MTKTSASMRIFFDPTKETAAHYAFWDDELVDMINIAMAIQRPLLLTGDPGVGKSSVARAVATAKKWALLKETIRSRSEADDLKSTFDAVRRLSDGSVTKSGSKEMSHYVWPGILWQAFAPNDAKDFLSRNGERSIDKLDEDAEKPGRAVLIDEIDKGDLDFANDLLDAFDEGNFNDPFTGHPIKRDADNNLLLAITSNAERDLSPAFERRCVCYNMKPPKLNLAVKIGTQHLAYRKARRGKVMRDWFKPSEHLPRLAELARFSSTQSQSVENALNVSTFIDVIDAMLEFQPYKKNWNEFVTAMEDFAATRATSGV